MRDEKVIWPMQFYEKNVQSWKNVCIVRYEFLCGKYQCHQLRLLSKKCIKPSGNVSTVNLRLGQKLLSFAKTAKISEGLLVQQSKLVF